MKEAFEQTPIHALLQLNIRDNTEVGYSTVDMPITPNTFGSTGNVHGGAIATMLDVACASAAARASGFEPGLNTLVTADLHVRYLGRPHGDNLRAEARVVKVGRQLVVVEGKVLDDEDRLIASADFAAMIVPLRGPLRPDAAHEPLAAEM